jgi:hypothetical protein
MSILFWGKRIKEKVRKVNSTEQSIFSMHPFQFCFVFINKEHKEHVLTELSNSYST